jgi:hypothetical protein
MLATRMIGMTHTTHEMGGVAYRPTTWHTISSVMVSESKWRTSSVMAGVRQPWRAGMSCHSNTGYLLSSALSIDFISDTGIGLHCPTPT